MRLDIYYVHIHNKGNNVCQKAKMTSILKRLDYTTRCNIMMCHRPWIISCRKSVLYNDPEWGAGFWIYKRHLFGCCCNRLFYVHATANISNLIIVQIVVYNIYII
jgi:hypothetical protein